MFIERTDIAQSYTLDDLDRLTDSTDAVWQSELGRVIELVSSYLRARYDVTAVFAATGSERNQMIVSVVIDILIYNLLARVNNTDIPATRKERYDGNSPQQTGGAIGLLKQIAKGQVEPDLPLREDGQEDQTGNIVMSGNAEDSTLKNSSF